MQGKVTVITRVPGEMERSASGTADVVAGKQHIIYNEILEDGSSESVKTHLVLGDDFFEVRRHGAVETRMHFSKGNACTANYTTPYGTIPMELMTSELLIRRETERIRVHVEYGISSQGGEALDRVIEVEIKQSTADYM